MSESREESLDASSNEINLEPSWKYPRRNIDIRNGMVMSTYK
jgi:hypothetical protein